MMAGPSFPPYVGFWNRTAAALIDSALLLVVTLPLQQAFSGAPAGFGVEDVVVGYLLPAIAILVFWKYRSATPGKIFMGAEIVDAATGGKPSNRQLVIRYLGYYVATIPLLLGLVWVGLDPRKQGWHDKLAGTVVVSTTPAPAGAPRARYAPTSPWTYALCAPVLILLAVTLAAAFALVLRGGTPPPDVAGLL